MKNIASFSLFILLRKILYIYIITAACLLNLVKRDLGFLIATYFWRNFLKRKLARVPLIIAANE